MYSGKVGHKTKKISFISLEFNLKILLEVRYFRKTLMKKPCVLCWWVLQLSTQGLRSWLDLSSQSQFLIWSAVECKAHYLNPSHTHMYTSGASLSVSHGHVYTSGVSLSVSHMHVYTSGASLGLYYKSLSSMYPCFFPTGEKGRTHSLWEDNRMMHYCLISARTNNINRGLASIVRWE